MRNYPKKAINRFESKVDKTENCHIWTAAKQKQGYGMFSYNGNQPLHTDLHIFFIRGISQKIW